MRTIKGMAAALLLAAVFAPAAAEVAPLPVDLSGGRPYSKESCLSDTLYEDASLRVEITEDRVDTTRVVIARVRIADPSQLRTAMATRYGGTGTALPDRLARRANAVLAINGDFFNFNSTGYLVRQGKLYRDKANESFDMLIIDENADFHILIEGNQL